MIGEPDAGKPHVRFDEGVQETCDIAARLRPTLQRPAHLPARAFRARHNTNRDPRFTAPIHAQALRRAISASSFFFARCISMAASVSDCVPATCRSSAIVTPVRR
jgi:hypothetical protein